MLSTTLYLVNGRVIVAEAQLVIGNDIEWSYYSLNLNETSHAELTSQRGYAIFF